MIRYHKKRDGILRIEPDGSCRFLAIWERVLLMFGAEP
jgi:hypothetical protein